MPIKYTDNPGQYTLLPGLYVTEKDPPRFARGIDTGVIGIVGETVRGPVNTPVSCANAEELTSIFGGRDHGDGVLANYVWRALLNKTVGRIVVVRAAAAAAAAATLTLDSKLTVTASSVGKWGNNLTAAVEDATDGDANHFNLVIAYSTEGRTVTYENLNIQSGQVNIDSVVGDALSNLVTLTVAANGRPVNSAAASLATGSDGTIASTDYTGTGDAIDQILAYDGVKIIVEASSGDDTFVQALNADFITKSANVADRIFVMWSGDHADSRADQLTYSDALAQGDRYKFAWNSPYTVDPETATQIQTPPHHWVAAALSQLDVDEHPGAYKARKYFAGISKLTNESLTWAQLVELEAGNVSVITNNSGYTMANAVMLTDDTGKRDVMRRRSADFLIAGMADVLKYFVNARLTEANRRSAESEVIAYLETLKKAQRIVEDYNVDIDSVNTSTNLGQGIFYVLASVRLIGTAKYIPLIAEIGATVVISET